VGECHEVAKTEQPRAEALGYVPKKIALKGRPTSDSGRARVRSPLRLQILAWRGKGIKTILVSGALSGIHDRYKPRAEALGYSV
jgi:hypothetical protein